MKTKWKSRKWPMRRLICLVTASMLAVGFIIAVPALGGTAHAVNLNETCSLTVTVEPKAMKDGPEESPDVVLDLYKVADAVEVSGYDTYSYRIAPGSIYAGLDLEDIETNEQWQAVARQAAELTFSNNKAADVAAETLTGDKLTAPDLTTGLYLVIARGRGLSPQEYIVSEPDVATIAYSPSYVFTYEPQLISLPTKEPEEGGNAMTSNRTDWDYTPSVVLKPQLSERFGALRIDKTLSNYLEGSPATFVFHVQATLPGTGRTVYEEYVTLTFDGPGRKSILLAAEFQEGDEARYAQLKTAKIPVGASVTVTEVYSGTTYSAIGSDTVTIEALGSAKPDAADFNNNVAAFTNAYNNTGNKGGSITNQFSYTTDDGWSWEGVEGPNATVTIQGGEAR